MNVRSPDPRVEAFRDPALTKAQRAALVGERFPSTATMATASDVRPGWLAPEAMASGVDDEVEQLAAIMRDVARHDQSDARKDGPKRSTLDQQRTRELLRQFAGQDHTTLPFPEAFRLLAGDRSYRHVATLTGMSKDKVSRLLHGRPPTRPEMEAVARGFRKHPSFFREYRDTHLVGELMKRLTDLPEASIDMYRQSVSSETR